MNPLQNLKDIHTPAAVESWPPAYGWWLLAALVVLCILLLTLWITKHRKNRQAKRQTLDALAKINSADIDCVSQLNQLLKRVAMTYFPEQNVQKMHGTEWTEFLTNTLPNKKAKHFSESFKSMQQNLYRANTSESPEFKDYKASAEIWIKQALPPSKTTIRKLEQNHA